MYFITLNLVIHTVTTKYEGVLVKNCDGIPELPGSILG